MDVINVVVTAIGNYWEWLWETGGLIGQVEVVVTVFPDFGVGESLAILGAIGLLVIFGMDHLMDREK